MKKTLVIMMLVGLVAGMATHVNAKQERENAPRGKAVLATLKELGEPHYVDRMKVHEFCSLEIGDTFFHVYTGELKKMGYHIIFYDNSENYLGFYKIEYEPTDYEEGAILLDSGDGEDFYEIPIGIKGPPDTIRIDGMPVKFIKSPSNTGEGKDGEKAKAATPESATAAAEEDDTPKPEFRTWTIAFKGKPIQASAIFIKQEKNMVTLKLEANGKEKAFSVYSLSKEDQAYIKQFQ